MVDGVTEAGFEIGGEFYPWKINDTGKDFMLWDRFTGIPVDQMADVLSDDEQRGRAPVIFSMVAMSVRAAHPDWSVERIVRLVMDTPLSEITMIEGEEEDDAGPPAETAAPISPSSAVESSSLLTPAESSSLEMLHAIPRSSTSRG